MGYLAQRKKHIRTDFILKSLIILLGLFSLFAFVDNAAGQFLNQWRFQFYLLSFVVMAYAAFSRFFLYSFFALLLLLLNFFVVSSSVPILFSGAESKNGTLVRLVYQQEPAALLDVFETLSVSKAELLAVVNPVRNDISPAGLLPAHYHTAGNIENGSFMVTSEQPVGAGRINLGGGNMAAFATIKIKDKDYVFLSLDLSKETRAEREKALEYVSDFVASQDDPIIIFGDFGMAAWTPILGKFLDTSGLEVKNQLFSLERNLMLPPTAYVVGYRNLDFVGSRYLPRRDNRFAPLLFRLKI